MAFIIDYLQYSVVHNVQYNAKLIIIVSKNGTGIHFFICHLMRLHIDHIIVLNLP